MSLALLRYPISLLRRLFDLAWCSRMDRWKRLFNAACTGLRTSGCGRWNLPANR